MTDFAPETVEFYQRDPEAAFAHLRATDPVHWYEPGRFWCLTRQAEIRAVSRQSQGLLFGLRHPDVPDR